MWRDVKRCRDEIASLEAELRAGHPDVAGLCMALMDWHAELQLLIDRAREFREPT